MELAKVQPAVRTLTGLILDREHPPWKPDTDHKGWKAVDMLISALDSKDPDARLGARWSLIMLTPLAYKPLQAALQSGNPMIKAGAEEVLSLYRKMLIISHMEGNNQVVEEYREEMEALASTIREEMDISESLEKLVQWLGSNDPHRMFTAAKELARLRDPAGVPPLCEALSKAEKERLKSAIAEALGAAGGAQALEALKKAIENETNLRMASKYCWVLLQHQMEGRHEIIEKVIDRVNTADPENINLMQLLNMCRGKTIWRTKLIQKMIASENINVKIHTIYCFRKWDDPKLLIGLLDDPDARVRGEAAQKIVSEFYRSHLELCHKTVLKYLKDKTTGPRIMQSIGSMYRQPAAAKLIPEAAKALLPWLEKDPSYHAVYAASCIKDPILVPPLVKLLKHSNRSIRMQAYSALMQWTVQAGFRPAGNDEESRIRALTKWLEDNPDFLKKMQPEHAEPRAPKIPNEIF
jgi:HEAT repeat protein